MGEEKPLHDEPIPGFDGLYGLEVLSMSEEEVRARVRIQPHHLQPAGLVHGGVIAAISEATTSMATHLAVSPDGKVAMGLANQASFLRPVTGSEVRATARRRHKGSTTWIWEVDVTDDHDRLCALVRITVAVRDARPDA